MKTQILNTTQNDIQEAAALLRQGGLVAIPTETVYGLAADALNEDAICKIFEAKGRPQDNPLIVHIGDITQLSTLCLEIPVWAGPIIERFWPGPLTLLLKKHAIVPDVVTCGLASVAVRFPSHPVAQQIIRAAGCPLAAPSANVSGRPSPTTFSHVLEDLDGKIDAIVDGGPCAIGLESTVLDIRTRPPRILRPGGVSVEALREVSPDVCVDKAVYATLKEGETPISPGMKYRHYSPKAPVIIVRGEEAQVLSYIADHADESSGVLCYDENRSLFSCGFVLSYGAKTSKETLAQNLFDRLRRFDQLPVSVIYAQCPDDTGMGLAISNRLQKAAGFHIIDI